MTRVVAVAAVGVVLVAGATVALTRGSPSEEGPGSSGSDGPWLEKSCTLAPSYMQRIRRGTFPGRSPDLQFVPREPHFFGSFEVTTHSGPWDYLQEVPLVLYGPGFIESRGDVRLDRDVTVADIAPTFAELLGTPFPERAGRALTEALVPRPERSRPPKMILMVVWDGGGWNTLDQWPNAWPNLKALMSEGTSFVDATVGSSPSVTPAIHATIGTGAFPRAHGLVDIWLRQGSKVPDSYPGKAPTFLELTSLADLYDLATGNRALVGMMAERAWHLGMLGRGAGVQGADKDIAVMTQGGDGRFITNTEHYSLPVYLDGVEGFEDDLELVDASDGRMDGRWLGNLIPPEKEAGPANPVWTRYQRRVLETLFTTEGFGRDSVGDVFFTNFKEIDLVGHTHNVVNPEMRSVLRHTDDVLGQLVEYLQEHVGRNEWVLAVTADHGTGPDPRSVGAWPIDLTELRVDIAARFGVKVSDLFQAQRPTGVWLAPDILETAGITIDEIADFVLDYRIGDNVTDDQDVPTRYRTRMDERLFAAAFPGDRIDEVADCVAGA